LHGGHTKIEKDAIHCGNSKVSEDHRNLVIDRVHQRDATFKILQSIPGQLKSALIAIQSNDANIGHVAKQRLTMTPKPHGGVDHH